MKKTRIISITNQKGGVGKTTTAINLSACLAQKGKRVLLIDMDPQANSTKGLGIESHKLNRTVHDILLNTETKTENVIYKTNFTNLDVIPSNLKLSGAEIDLSNDVGGENALKEGLDGVRKNYDYIIIDCPPSLGRLTINALSASREVFIPTQLHYFALEGIDQLIKIIHLVKRRINRDLDISGIICTMYDERTKLNKEALGKIQKLFGRKIFKTKIKNNIKLAEATGRGLPIIHYDKASTGALGYQSLAEEIIKR